MRVSNLLIKNALPWFLSFGLAFFASMAVTEPLAATFGVRAGLALTNALLLSALSSSLRFVLRGDVRRGGAQRFALVLLFGGGLLTTGASVLWMSVLADAFVPTGGASGQTLRTCLAAVGVFSAHFAYFYAALAEGVLRDAELESLGRELREKEMELSLLSAKFSPHFLFNALNSVAALTRKDPSKAYSMCVALGDYLRESLRREPGRISTLTAELQLVRDYLALEKLRYGERIAVLESLELPDDEAFPGFVLQLLAENAVKHGVATLDEGCAISIRAVANADFVEVSIENPFGRRAARGSTHVGLDIAKAQVALFSKGSATFSSLAEAGVFRVVIRWPRGAMEPGS